MPNALIHSRSPYLLQHAHNPVDWCEWGDEAFARARAEDKPVFLSVGYSTCHWCHVMERESFENEAIAELINRHFIAIKVDREERPDVDSTYMAYLQATTGRGGWPMSVFLSPDGEPFFAGTYFPPEDRYGSPSFARVLNHIAELWRSKRKEIEENSKRWFIHLQAESQALAKTTSELPSDSVYGHFLDMCESLFDERYGGFGNAPKFPRPALFVALFQLANRFGSESAEGKRALDMALLSLRAICSGGIHDQLGGGFHRYSVDCRWHVPHYEKMLYDQAQMILVLLSAWRLSKDELFSQTIFRTVAYMENELCIGNLPAFACAQDADSLPHSEATAKREGAYWTWTAKEIAELLPPLDAALFAAAYGIEEAGNAAPDSDPHGELAGQNTLYVLARPEQLAPLFELSEADIATRLAECRRILHAARSERPKPHLDDKILTAWNGLALAALAEAGATLGQWQWVARAEELAEFLLQKLHNGEHLLRTFRGQEAAPIAAFPADYSALIHGLISLHYVVPEAGWLAKALAMQEEFDRRYWHEQSKTYPLKTTVLGHSLPAPREAYDGAEPAPDHLTALNLIRLGALTEDTRYTDRARELLAAGRHTLLHEPFAAPLLLTALDCYERTPQCIELACTNYRQLLTECLQQHRPLAVYRLSPDDQSRVCHQGSCQAL